MCNPTYIYKANLNKCQCPANSIIIGDQCFQCSSLFGKNSTGGINSTTGNTCRCARTYEFNAEAKACLCPDDANSYISTTKQCVSCTGVENSLGTVNSQRNGCNCDETFTYSLTLKKCITPPKSQIIKDASCPEGLQWDTTLEMCLCQAGFALQGTNCIDCTSMTHSTGASSDRISCTCESGYSWDNASFSCL